MRFQSSALLSLAIATLLRAIAFTWRMRVTDEAGLLDRTREIGPVIWVCWHNRIVVIPILYTRYFRHRRGGVLISRSRDGGIVSGVIERFGGEPVRGSSSRGGASALRELQRRMGEGSDAYITPDGPKGPRYSVGPGALWLARETSAPLLPVSMECSSCWRLGSWDGFIIPRPFASVHITLRRLHHVSPESSGKSIDEEREILRQLLMEQTELH